MSTISDEVGNLVQHVKDVAAKIGHLLSGQASEELDKLEAQAGAVHDLVKADVEQDAGDVAADVHTDEQAAQSSLDSGDIAGTETGIPPHTASSPAPAEGTSQS